MPSQHVRPGMFSPREATLGSAVDTAALVSSNDDCRYQLSDSRVRSLRAPVFVNGDLTVNGQAEANNVARQLLPKYWLDEQCEVPSLGIVKLHDAMVFGGRISKRQADWHWNGQLTLTSSGDLVRGSYGIMDGGTTLPRDLLAHVDGKLQFIAERTLLEANGPTMLLGSVHSHFGHFLLEGLSRVWGAYELAHFSPDMKFQVYEPELPAFAYEILGMAGVPREQIVRSPSAVRISELYIPDTSSRTHTWLSPLHKRVWDKIGNCVLPRSNHDKVFLSRAGTPDRPLLNTEAVEDLFRSEGFLVVRPETLSISEQISLVRSAKVLAGCVGSQMYLSAFRPAGSKTFVVAPSNFYLKDDAMIADLMDHELTVFFGTALDTSSKTKSEHFWSIDEEALKQAVRDHS